MDYITYLSTFDQLYDIPKERKTGEYRNYLLTLIEYLSWFVQRIKPLLDIDVEMQAEVDAVMAQWDSGTVPGWPVCFLHLKIKKKYTRKLFLPLERNRFCFG